MPNNTEFPRATYRYDPYRNFKFRVKWDNKYVAGVSKVSALTRNTQVITHRGVGDPGTPLRMPGQSEFQAITLERGVTHDVEFEQWANKVWDYHNSTVDDRQGDAGDQEVSLKDFRKDIVLEVYNELGNQPAILLLDCPRRSAPNWRPPGPCRLAVEPHFRRPG